jgi:pyruvate/2-oxoglutarate dehydrogenase complex dihydrolipoamide dehydrogenase (E3) component
MQSLTILLLAALACAAHAFVPATPFGHAASSFLCKRNLAGARPPCFEQARPKSKSSVLPLTMSQVYDLVVVGGGPVGLTAAVAATAVGKKAIIIDGTPRHLVQFTGPTGIFSKALRDSALRVDVPTLRSMGIRDSVIWNQVIGMSSAILRGNGLKNLGALQLKHIPHMRGTASFISSNKLLVSQDGAEAGKGVEVEGTKILVATGSQAYRVPGLAYDDKLVFDSDTIKNLNFLPKSIAIIGAGLIAVEYARIFSRLQCEVTLLVRQQSLGVAFKRIGMDPDVAIELEKDLNENKVKILYNVEVKDIEKPNDYGDYKDGPSKPLVIKLKQPDAKWWGIGQPPAPTLTTTEIHAEVMICPQKSMPSDHLADRSIPVLARCS